MSGRFDVYEDRANRWRFALKDSTGQLVAVGDAHETRDDALKACREVQAAAKDAEIVDLTEGG